MTDAIKLYSNKQIGDVNKMHIVNAYRKTWYFYYNYKIISSITSYTILGHKIHEIRERALKNLACKLENGYIFDNDLARSKEILQKLFEWFLFPECSQEDIVLNLIKNILQV